MRTWPRFCASNKHVQFNSEALALLCMATNYKVRSVVCRGGRTGGSLRCPLQARALARTARLGATRLALRHPLAGGVVERIATIAVHPELGACGDALAAAVLAVHRRRWRQVLVAVGAACKRVGNGGKHQSVHDKAATT